MDLTVDERFVSLRRALGVASFGINLMLLKPGQQGRIHDHREQEEVYVVLDGTLTLTVEGDSITLTSGEVARVPPGVRRQVASTCETTCAVLALGGAGEHVGRDGVAFLSWEDEAPREVVDVPLPPDLTAGHEPATS
jgi:mannose-6-phosphate isomerase-like protein (cupin superfamily)